MKCSRNIRACPKYAHATHRLRIFHDLLLHLNGCSYVVEGRIVSRMQLINDFSKGTGRGRCISPIKQTHNRFAKQRDHFFYPITSETTHLFVFRISLSSVDVASQIRDVASDNGHVVIHLVGEIPRRLHVQLCSFRSVSKTFMLKTHAHGQNKMAARTGREMDRQIQDTGAIIVNGRRVLYFRKILVPFIPYGTWYLSTRNLIIFGIAGGDRELYWEISHCGLRKWGSESPFPLYFYVL